MIKIACNAGKLLAIMTIAVFANNANAQDTKESAKEKTTTVTFTATEMGCGTDSKMVETALYRKRGVKNVKITGETITVIYNPEKVKPEELMNVIENTGTCEDSKAKVHKVTIKT